MAALHRLAGKQRKLFIVGIFLMTLVVVLAPFPIKSTPKTYHITLDATQFEFQPNRIQVGKGDRLIITLTASDVVHGFYLDAYGIEERVEPGVEKTIEFVANRAGKFRYRCLVSCGPLHPFMMGELVVGPNLPFWRAIGVVLIALVGLLVYFWQYSTGDQNESQTSSPSFA